MNAISLPNLVLILGLLIVTSCSKTEENVPLTNETAQITVDKMVREASLVNQNIPFRILNEEGEDITSIVTFYVNGEPIEGNSFSSTTIGEFEVYGVYIEDGVEITTNIEPFRVIIPKQKIVVEDYTGTWCGFCPRVAGAIQSLELETHDIVVVAVHETAISFPDPMHFEQVQLLKDAFGVEGLPAARINAQENGNFYGGLESNSQWLQTDRGINFLAPEDQFRANNYISLNYNLGKFTAGIQYESYLPSALLGYSPIYDGQNNIATYSLNYKNESLDITGGYIYEQFGSGLILRSWEDRQLGINNALKGLNIKFKATDYLNFKAVFGKQRNGFEESTGTIQGLDTELNISNALDISDIDIQLGISYVARYEDVDGNQALPSTVGAYSGRLDFIYKDFYAGVEAVIKDPDAIANEGQLASNKLYDGTALQVNAGYSKKGLGINASFRRLENK